MEDKIAYAVCLAIFFSPLPVFGLAEYLIHKIKRRLQHEKNRV